MEHTLIIEAKEKLMTLDAKDGCSIPELKISQPVLRILMQKAALMMAQQVALQVIHPLLLLLLLELKCCLLPYSA